MSKKARNYDLKAPETKAKHVLSAPKISYHPPRPRRFRPRIGLIGCGGISASHLAAYKLAGWQVVAMADTREEAATARQQEFYSEAALYTDYHALLARPDIDVVDIALHPAPRAAAIEAALLAGKHVLSQKPFVLDLRTGEKLVRLADQFGKKLAVNQNGRWAPYVSYMRKAIAAGHLGDVQTVAMTLNWDHTWTKGTAFEKIHHLVLYDFAIHWFDMATCFFGERTATRVFTSLESASNQEVAPPLLAQSVITYPGGGASLTFDARSKFNSAENITVTGSAGTLRARGGICAAHDLTITTKRGTAQVTLEGKWFTEGFLGTMGELLRAIEEDREPENSARNNLRSLALCFAAIRSADTGRPQAPGKVFCI